MEQQLVFDGIDPSPTMALGTLVKRETLDDADYAEDVVCRLLRDAGWSEIDGSYCSVFLSPCKTRVVKVATGWGQDATLRAARDNQHNPHFPRIFGLWDCDDCTVVECEALEPLNHGDEFEWEDEKTWPPEYLKWRRRWDPSDNENRIKYGPNGPMKEALKALQAAMGEDYDRWADWDVHPGNIMRRPSDGTLVLNDLLA